jgi:hypothetical protein
MDKRKLLGDRMNELADVIGIDLTLILVRDFGGRHLNVPNKAKATHNLALLIGLEALKKLCAYYGGTKLEIDFCRKVLSYQKLLDVQKGVQAGMTGSQLAKQFNTTERNIRRMKQRCKVMNS